MCSTTLNVQIVCDCKCTFSMYRLCVNVDESYQLYIDSMLVGVPYRYTVIVEYVVHRMNGRYSIDGGVPYDCTDIL